MLGHHLVPSYQDRCRDVLLEVAVLTAKVGAGIENRNRRGEYGKDFGADEHVNVDITGSQ